MSNLTKKETQQLTNALKQWLDWCKDESKWEDSGYSKKEIKSQAASVAKTYDAFKNGISLGKKAKHDMLNAIDFAESTRFAVDCESRAKFA